MRSENGSVMLAALVVLSSLLAMGGLAVLAVQRTTSSVAYERFRGIAMFSAESGVVAGMAFLRHSYDEDSRWSALVTANNESPTQPAGVPGNGGEPGTPNNPFSAELRGWYEVTILNNEDDPDLAAGIDSDARVVLRVKGHGPADTVEVVEVLVSGAELAGTARRCPGYAQRGLGEHGSGRNDCLSIIDSSKVETYEPGQP